MAKFSANLGFLWPELSLIDAIHAASDAGFSAVECHWPYNTPASDVKTALQTTDLPMIGINTARGDVAAGDNGVAAITGREAEARDYIDESIAYATLIECTNIHVMAGFTGKRQAARSTFYNNLCYASDCARERNITILIEPLNRIDAPGYHLSTLNEALDILSELDRENVKIMFDCYHMQIMQGDIIRSLTTHLDSVGHIQIAAVPDRSEPDSGELNYPNLFTAIDTMGWGGYIGAEYKPRTTTDEGLGWLNQYT